MFQFIAIIALAFVGLQIANVVLLARLSAKMKPPGPRGILPLGVADKLKPGESAQITARPQMFALMPERLFVGGGGAGNGASDWIVNDIKVCGRSQFCQAGDIPGDMFANKSIDSFLRFDMAERGLEVQVVVTYVGTNPEGCAFYGAIIGTALDDKEVPRQRKREVRRYKRQREVQSARAVAVN